MPSPDPTPLIVFTAVVLLCAQIVLRRSERDDFGVIADMLVPGTVFFTIVSVLALIGPPSLR